MIKKIESKADLEQFICENWDLVNQYIDKKSAGIELPFYNSVDIRESSTKFAPIDNNLYPAGFNNLCHLDLAQCPALVEKFIKSKNPNTKTVGLISESNTKNLFYLDHLATLRKLIENSGFKCISISFDDELYENDQNLVELTSHSGFSISLEKAYFKNGQIFSLSAQNGFDFIILNHDQSMPIEIPWSQVKVPVSPSPFLGWSRRKKYDHFKAYEVVLDEFCNEFSIPKDLLMAKYSCVNNVDFLTKDGLNELAASIDSMKKDLAEGNKVFVKASQGTYGMGISVVDSGEEIINMNRKTRNKMNAGKNSIKFSEVLVQEAVPTVLLYEGHPAEITIYLISGKPVGGFMRTNPERDSQSNLNSKGMIFTKFCISEIKQNRDHKIKEATYSIIARLSALASAHEN